MENYKTSRLRFQEVMERTWKILEQENFRSLRAWAELQPLLSRARLVAFPSDRLSRSLAKEIEPLLNLILKREQYHPTWTNLMRWILKNK